MGCCELCHSTGVMSDVSVSKTNSTLMMKLMECIDGLCPSPSGAQCSVYLPQQYVGTVIRKDESPRDSSEALLCAREL